MINLYSTHCPKCTVLEKKLKIKNIDFNLKDTEEDLQFLIDNGFKSAPIMEVDGEFLTFEKANEWLKARI